MYLQDAQKIMNTHMNYLTPAKEVVKPLVACIRQDADKKFWETPLPGYLHSRAELFK